MVLDEWSAEDNSTLSRSFSEETPPVVDSAAEEELSSLRQEQSTVASGKMNGHGNGALEEGPDLADLERQLATAQVRRIFLVGT